MITSFILVVLLLLLLLLLYTFFSTIFAGDFINGKMMILSRICIMRLPFLT